MFFPSHVCNALIVVVGYTQWRNENWMESDGRYFWKHCPSISQRVSTLPSWMLRHYYLFHLHIVVRKETIKFFCNFCLLFLGSATVAGRAGWERSLEFLIKTSNALVLVRRTLQGHSFIISMSAAFIHSQVNFYIVLTCHFPPISSKRNLTRTHWLHPLP